MARVPGSLFKSYCTTDLPQLMTAGAFPCPKCKNPQTKVLATGNADGELTRHRECLSCGHRFFTQQEPEYLTSRNTRISWGTGRPIAVAVPEPVR
jgi:Zn ribbon nucleic-acid-binding protein